MEVLDVKGTRSIRWYRGDTKSIEIRAADETGGVPRSLFGMRASFTAREKHSDVKVIEKSTVFSKPSVTLFFSHEETKRLKPGEYRYDVELRKEDYSVVCTLYTGTLTVLSDVTREGSE